MRVNASEPFSEYVNFNHTVLEAKARVLGQRSLLNDVLDIPFRYLLLNIGFGYRRPFRRYLSNGFRINLMGLSVGTRLAGSLLSALRFLRAGRSLALVYCPRAPAIELTSCSFFRENPNYFFNSLYCHFLFRYLSSLARLSLLRVPGFRTAMRDHSLASFERHIDLDLFDRQLDDSIDQLGSAMRRFGLSVFISQDFHSLVGRVLAVACRRAKVTSVEVAHGYTQNSVLLTLAPLSARYSIVWTDLLREDIRRVLPLDEQSRLTSFGPPFLCCSAALSTKRRTSQGNAKCLLVLAPLGGLDEDAIGVELERAKRLVLISSSFFSEVMLRLKSTDPARDIYSDAAWLRGYRISSGSLSSDLFWADFVIGSRSSSVLVEAAVYGKTSIEIVDSIASRPIEWSTGCTLNDLPSKLKAFLSAFSRGARDDVRGFRRTEFLEFLVSIS